MSQSPPADLFYPNGVLRNRLGITDRQQLARQEKIEAFARATEIQSAPPSLGETFTVERLQATHLHLFQDVYDWAGTFRTWDTAKPSPDGALTHFIAGDEVRQVAADVFGRLAAADYLAGYDEQTPEVLAAFYSDLNVVHAFHEGNGRTNRLYVAHLAHARGFQIDYPSMGRADLMNATIAAGRGRPRELMDLFMHASTPIDPAGPSPSPGIVIPFPQASSRLDPEIADPAAPLINEAQLPGSYDDPRHGPEQTPRGPRH